MQRFNYHTNLFYTWIFKVHNILNIAGNNVREKYYDIKAK